MSARILSASARVAIAALVLATSVVAQSNNQISFVKVAGAEQRLRYLASARIWSEPGDVTPEMVMAGRPLAESEGLEAARRGQPLPCNFAKPGKALGGNTPKFACVTPGGTAIRVKYSDGFEGWQPRDLFSGRVGETSVGSRVLVRSDLSDHDRLPRLPGRPDVWRGTTRQTLVPRNIPTAIEQSGHGYRG